MKLVLIALALTAGCSSVVPSTIARLNAISPMEADPQDIAIALDLPDTVGITQGSAQMLMTATRRDTEQTSSETYILATMHGSDGSTIYAIAEADFGRIRAQQTLIQQWKEEAGRATSGSVGVNLKGCSIGDGPDEDDVMSIRIRTDTDGPFFPLVRDTPVKKVLEFTEIGALEPCA